MPSKKRKYEARFPPARIKKIMQTDEEIGKVAAAVPVIISRSLEIFLQSLIETTAQYTNERKAKTMTTAHLKHCIEGEKKFDFLKDLVANIADISTQEEEEGGEQLDKPKKTRKPRMPGSDKKKKKKESSDDVSDRSSDDDEKVPLQLQPSATQASIPQSCVNLPIPASISSTVSSNPSSMQQNSHSIDSIMGKNYQSITETGLPSQNTFTPSVQTNFPSATGLTSNPIQMTMSLPKHDDEDDDYDT